MKRCLPALLCLPWLALAQAEESAQQIVADESTPAQEKVTDLGRFEFAQKATLQGGYGPEDGTLGNDRKGFYGLRYVPSLTWRSSLISSTRDTTPSAAKGLVRASSSLPSS